MKQQCRTCKLHKETSEFYFYKSRKRFYTRCIKCYNLYNKKQYHKTKASRRTKRRNSFHKYYYEQRSTSYRESPKFWAKALHSNVSTRAKKHKIIKTIDAKWIYDRLLLIDFKCELTNIEFDRKKMYHMSIDRIDNTKGYTKENCRIVLESINYFKHTGTDDDIYYIAKKLLKLQ